MSIPAGAGAIVSTPTDLVKFIDALFAGKLINRSDLELMKTMKDNFGMAMFTIPFDDKKGYGHSGGIDGFSSLLVYFPQDKLAIAYTSNGARYSTNDVVKSALSIYFNRPFAIPDFKTITLSTTILNKYVGNYSSTQIPIRIAITAKNKILYAQASGPRGHPRALPLEFKGNDTFTYSFNETTLQFDVEKNSFSLIQGGTTYLFTKAN